MTTKKEKPETYYLECRCNAYEKDLSNSYTYKSEGLEINIKYCDDHRQEIQDIIAECFS